MAFLMSDMAAGSTAVRTMQQNMIGAQYDEANIAANAQGLQDKLQSDKLKIEQEQQDINKTRLANLVAQTSLDTTTQSKSAMEKVRSSTEYKTAPEGEQARMLAAALMPIDPSSAEKIRELGAAADLKEQQTKTLKMVETDNALSKARATLEGVPSKDIHGLIESWPDEMKASVKSFLPGYENEDPETLKKQLDHLMLNAKGQNTAMLVASRERIAERQADAKVEAARERSLLTLLGKMEGRDGSQTEKDQRQTQQVVSQANVLEQRSGKEIKVLEDARKEAGKRAGEYRLFGWKQGEADTAYKQAWNDEQDKKREVADRTLDLYTTLPPSDNKERLIAKQIAYLKTLDSDAPPDLRGESKQSADGPPKAGSTNANKAANAGKSKDSPLPMPATKADAKVGTWYQTAQGPAMWDGAKFTTTEATPSAAKPIATDAGKAEKHDVSASPVFGGSKTVHDRIDKAVSKIPALQEELKQAHEEFKKSMGKAGEAVAKKKLSEARDALTKAKEKAGET